MVPPYIYFVDERVLRRYSIKGFIGTIWIINNITILLNKADCVVGYFLMDCVEGFL